VVFLILGFGLLLLLILAVRAFLSADPKQLLHFFRWFLISLGAAAAVILLLFSFLSERPLPGFILLGILGYGLRLWRQWRQAAGRQGTGRISEVETPTLRMRLDHGSGEMTGTVLRGAFTGRRLDELSEAEIVALWRECRVADEPASRLLETYLDRLQPDWRERTSAQPGGEARAPNSDAMSHEEAYALLGLAKGADAAAIREAHHKLMMKLHPDHGGSTYLAAKINRAKEILLGS
jgi:DnaJ domain